MISQKITSQILAVEIQKKIKYFSKMSKQKSITTLNLLIKNINTLQDISNEYYLSINKSKSGIMHQQEKTYTINEKNTRIIQGSSSRIFRATQLQMNILIQVSEQTIWIKPSHMLKNQKAWWNISLIRLNKQQINAIQKITFYYENVTLDPIFYTSCRLWIVFQKPSRQLCLDYGNTRLKKYAIFQQQSQISIYKNSQMIQIIGADSQNNTTPRRLNLANGSALDRFQGCLQPTFLKGKNISGMPDNLPKVFSYQKYYCKTHKTRFKHIHFLLHARIELELFKEVLINEDIIDKNILIVKEKTK